MKNINKILFSFLLLIILGACEEQVLDKEAREIFSETDVWADEKLTTQFVNTIYNGLGYFNVGSGFNFYDEYSDEAWNTIHPDVWAFNQGILDPSTMSRFEPVWGDKYEYIRMANIFFDEIETASISDAVKSELTGEVKYLRARFYFDLIKLFGGVPLITEAFELDDDFTVERADYETMVDWIVKELDEARELVPMERPDSEWGRVTKGACLGTKSMVLLHANSLLHDPSTSPNGPLFDYTKNTWQECADAAKAVIDMPMYELQEVETWEDYHQMFFEANPGIVFGRAFHNDFGVTAMRINTLKGPAKDQGFNNSGPTQNIVDAFQMANGLDIDDPNSGYDPAPDKIYENRELRFYANILFQGSVWKTPLEFYQPGGIEVNTPPRINNGYSFRKHLDPNTPINETGNAPWAFIRLETMYLNYAEAQYHLGNEEEARQYVNAIRNRVGLPDIESSGEELFEDIQHERRIELAFEGHRFYDVRRWMIAPETDNVEIGGIAWKIVDENGNLDPNGTFTYDFITMHTRTFTEKMYYLPIPRDEILKSDLQQNPGYSE